VPLTSRVAVARPVAFAGAAQRPPLGSKCVDSNRYGSTMSVARRSLGRARAYVVLVLVAACTDQSFGIPNTDGFAPSTGPDIAEAPPQGAAKATPCIAYTPPVDGADCSLELNITARAMWDATCEYGHDIARKCNDVFDCVGGSSGSSSGGSSGSSGSFGSSGGTWSRRKRNACAGRCPETFDGIVPGAQCQTKPFLDVPEVACSYLEGTCACVADADAGTSSSSDGGLTSRPGHWRCAPPPRNGCPAQRPPLGSECVRPMDCDYGSCIIERDLSFSCVGRAWVQTDSDAGATCWR
jgi:hypothetical protein